MSLTCVVKLHHSRALLSLQYTVRQPALPRTASLWSAKRRQFATHRETPASSLLSKSLDRAANREGLNSNARLDTLGPFPLGIDPSSSYQKTQKPWKELSAKGKVARGTARTTNLTVILVGGAFTCVLAYALATELFAKNSPTKLYENACEKVKSSPEVARYLKPPLRFHINAPSPNAPRHRNRHVSSQLAHDDAGREHLLLHFFVESTKSKSAESNDSIFALSEMDFDSAIEWSNHRLQEIFKSSKRAFAYLVGIKLPPDSSAKSLTSEHPPQSTPHEESKKDHRSAWGFAGIFTSIRGTKPSREQPVNLAGINWDEGEVHADLVKNAKGDFQYRYLFVDIPDSSRTRKQLRIYVEKGQGFREGEGVFVVGS